MGKDLDTIQFIDNIEVWDFIYVTESQPQGTYKLTTLSDTLIANQNIERDTRVIGTIAEWQSGVAENPPMH